MVLIHIAKKENKNPAQVQTSIEVQQSTFTE